MTEEYIDLEARIRTKKALEAQFLEIMKQARKISDAMEVQTQLAEVRTEIERLEGRRRFLENQSALSTINITLHTPTPVVAAATRGFVYDLKAAFGDGDISGRDIPGHYPVCDRDDSSDAVHCDPYGFSSNGCASEFPAGKSSAVSVTDPASDFTESLYFLSAAH